MKYGLKKNLGIAAVALAFASCTGGSSGDLVGVTDYDGWQPVTPFGMNFVNMGSYTMGSNDEDVPFANVNQSKTVSVASFYIDDQEISNSEYKQFVQYVRDSLAHTLLGEEGIGEHYVPEEELPEDYDGDPVLNWNEPIEWDDPEAKEALEELFIPSSERYYGQRIYDVRKMNFTYYWLNYLGASDKGGRDKVLSNNVSEQLGTSTPVLGHSDRGKFIIKEVTNVYPDTLVWVHDLTYAQNDAMTENYFWHPAYGNYPVVGVTWSQARAFNVFRTRLINMSKVANGDLQMPSFRLPTETEWEYAARGGRDLASYPWGGPYIRNMLGCPLANFKPLRGDYVEDGGFYTVPTTSYEPNDYGLFCMAGNVSEWTSTTYDESVFELATEMNMDYNYQAKADDAPSLKRKVIRGGSWKDIPYFLQCGTRTYEYQDTAKSYVGFRSAMSYLGQGIDE
ncbi:MAG: sulfatase modifying factor 1 [Sphingobacteriales bacterium]|jgi:sulfatase modifying factor 1